MVKRHLRWWCDGFSQPIIMLISYTWWGVLRALLSLLCGLHSMCVRVCFFWQQTVLLSTSEFRIPNVSGFRILYQSRFQIPNFKISWIPDSRFCYMAATQYNNYRIARRRGKTWRHDRRHSANEENVDGRVGKVSRPLTQSTPSTCSYQHSLNSASSHPTIWNTK